MQGLANLVLPGVWGLNPVGSLCVFFLFVLKACFWTSGCVV